MRVSHWTDFTPSSSQIDNFYGGVVGTPEVGYNAFNNRGRTFASVAYRLHVSSTHNGWHHFLGMYTTLQGIAFENACVKKDCRTGYHHFCFNFSMPSPEFTIGSGTTAEKFHEGSYRSTFMYAGEIGQYDYIASADSDTANASEYVSYGSNSTWAENTIGMHSINHAGRIQDLFVLRPTLVHPTNPDSWFDLWNHAQYAGTSGGQQMFFTGIPMAHPRFATNSFTVSPGGAVSGGGSTSWGNTSVHGTTPLLNPFTIASWDATSFTVPLTNGSGNTVITWQAPIEGGTLKVLVSTTGYPTSTDTNAVSGTTQTITHSSSFTGTYYVKVLYNPAAFDTPGETRTITFTNNSQSKTQDVELDTDEK
tara:strand:+ start:784 stop:1875 length:1092 start_codon:yes stop_codon:yes gene_type:complete